MPAKSWRIEADTIRESHGPNGHETPTPIASQHPDAAASSPLLERQKTQASGGQNNDVRERVFESDDSVKLNQRQPDTSAMRTQFDAEAQTGIKLSDMFRDYGGTTLPNNFDLQAHALDLLTDRLAQTTHRQLKRYPFAGAEFLLNFVLAGKKVRPLCLILAAASLGRSIECDVLLRIAVATELAHRATLIYDDAIDHSHFRNGSMSIHTVLSAEHAILAAGLLQSIAADIMPPSLSSRFLQSISSAAYGHLLEKSFWSSQEGSIPFCANDLEAIENLIDLKSGSFAHFIFDAAFITAKAEVPPSIYIAAKDISFAYQLINDLAELIEWLGSDADVWSCDLANRTPTASSFLAIHEATMHGDTRLYRFYQSRLDLQPNMVRDLFKNFDPIEKTQILIKRRLQNGITILRRALPENEYRYRLLNLIQIVWPSMYGSRAGSSDTSHAAR